MIKHTALQGKLAESLNRIVVFEGFELTTWKLYPFGGEFVISF
jgi:hypothetical protein